MADSRCVVAVEKSPPARATRPRPTSAATESARPASALVNSGPAADGPALIEVDVRERDQRGFVGRLQREGALERRG